MYAIGLNHRIYAAAGAKKLAKAVEQARIAASLPASGGEVPVGTVVITPALKLTTANQVKAIAHAVPPRVMDPQHVSETECRQLAACYEKVFQATLVAHKGLNG